MIYYDITKIYNIYSPTKGSHNQIALKFKIYKKQPKTYYYIELLILCRQYIKVIW